MALHLYSAYNSVVVLLVTTFCLSQLCLCFNLKSIYLPKNGGSWSSAGATWYGSPDGAGSDGGACGYGNSVSQPPFSSMVTAVGPSLYQSGEECGACYQVKCTTSAHPSCSGEPVKVVITDSCPGGPCAAESAHFDLSGTAFGAMAIPGQESKLRDAGVLEVTFARVACDYSGKTIAFQVDAGSNPNYFAVLIKYEQGDGDLAEVDLKEGTTGAEGWRSMQQSWGAVWKLDAGSALKPPFSIRLTSKYSNEIIVADNVIPENWQAGATYRSLVNY